MAVVVVTQSALAAHAQGATGWVCRHDLGGACRLAAERTGLGIEYLSTVAQTPRGSPPPESTCNVGRTKALLGWEVHTHAAVGGVIPVHAFRPAIHTRLYTRLYAWRRADDSWSPSP